MLVVAHPSPFFFFTPALGSKDTKTSFGVDPVRQFPIAPPIPVLLFVLCLGLSDNPVMEFWPHPCVARIANQDDMFLLGLEACVCDFKSHAILIPVHPFFPPPARHHV